MFRVDPGPSHIKRLGHFVVMSKNFEKTLGWYREMLGFRCSDEFYAGDPNNVVGSFNRLDRGDDYVDHHAFFCIRGDKSGLNHLSYEAADIDDVMAGHEQLEKKGYQHMWGIGRHLIGSQLFDYWADPWGRVHEHWADTDVLERQHSAQSPGARRRRRRAVGPADPADLHGPRLALGGSRPLPRPRPSPRLRLWGEGGDRQVPNRRSREAADEMPDPAQQAEAGGCGRVRQRWGGLGPGQPAGRPWFSPARAGSAARRRHRVIGVGVTRARLDRAARLRSRHAILCRPPERRGLTG